MKKIRVLIISANELVLRGVNGLLGQDQDIEIVGECGSAEDASFEVSRLAPDVAILDHRLAGITLPETVRSIKQSRPGYFTGVILLSDYFAGTDAFSNSGADALLSKDATGEDFKRTIKQVYLRSRNLARWSEKNDDIVELIIPPPADAAALFRFISQLGQLLEGSFESILYTTGSPDRGTIITIRANTRIPDSLPIELANLAEVEMVEELSSSNGTVPPAEKYELMPRLGINPTKKLQVTLA
jgi:CheY-like chemotaxis protein